jgi:hypothetical protein
MMYTVMKLPSKPIKQLFLTDERRWQSHLSADVWVASRHLLQRMTQCINLITGWLCSLTPTQHILVKELISFRNFNAHFLHSLTICMLHYNPRHVSSINMPIFRRTNCIIIATGIVTLCKWLYRE